MRPLKVEEIMDQEVQNLSGGELQRLAMALCTSWSIISSTFRGSVASAMIRGCMYLLI